MESVIVGLIFVVGLIVVVGVILRGVQGAASVGKSAATGLAITNGPVRSTWRGLPLPVDSGELLDMTKVPMNPPLPAGTHSVAFTIPGSRVAVLAQWFENNWPRNGFAMDPADKVAMQRTYVFHDTNRGGAVTVSFQLESSPSLHTACLIMDLREAQLQNGEQEAQPRLNQQAEEMVRETRRRDAVTQTVVHGTSNVGKGVVAGTTIQNGPVRSTWHGPVRSTWRELPLPVPRPALSEVPEVAAKPSMATETRTVGFTIRGSSLAVVAQWFENTWTRSGLAMDPADKTPMRRWYVFRDTSRGGVVIVHFQLEQQPEPHTAVLITDLREARMQEGESETQRREEAATYIASPTQRPTSFNEAMNRMDAYNNRDTEE